MEKSEKPRKGVPLLFFNYVWIAGMATVVDTGVLVLLRVKLGLYVWLSAALGYGCGMITNFLLNKYLNFASSARSILKQARTFFIVAIIGLGMTALLMELFVQALYLKLLVAKALSILIVMTWSFWGHHTLTFQDGIRKFIARRFGSEGEADSNRIPPSSPAA
jgi:putative flippase GtrA